MPTFDFLCPQRHVFDAHFLIAQLPIESAECPKCGDIGRKVWLKAPGIKPDTIAAIRIGGRDLPLDYVERQLDHKEEERDFWDEEGEEQRFYDIQDKMVGKYLAGDLPPMTLSDSDTKTLKEGLGVKE